MVKRLLALFGLGTTFFFHVLPLHGATDANSSAATIQDHARFVGALGCQSSMCHGGASPSRDQFTIWTHDDFHSRAYATLVTARSARIAESLGIASATESVRCTVCHAPLADVPSDHLASTANVTEGVSCENCHGAASTWLRGHTRPDWTYADRVQAGLRDLRSTYVRANTCVACHQVLDSALLQAGHPELIFELDGQTASEPRHWTEKADWSDAKAWLVGQAVALREISRQSNANNEPDGTPEENALAWLLQQVPSLGWPYAGKARTAGPSDGFAVWGNQVAEKISSQDWNTAMSTLALTALASTSASFTDNTVPLPERELRAERLVLGLDRLFKSLHPESNAPGNAELSTLFDAVQDRAQFDPVSFSKLLQKFADVVAPKK